MCCDDGGVNRGSLLCLARVFQCAVDCMFGVSGIGYALLRVHAVESAPYAVASAGLFSFFSCLVCVLWCVVVLCMVLCVLRKTSVGNLREKASTG